MGGSPWHAPAGEAVDRIDSLAGRPCEPAARLKDGSIPFARLVSATRSARSDIVTPEVSVDAPQDRVHDIRTSERISVRFPRDDSAAPRVLASRKDSLPVMHAEVCRAEAPLGLCLFEDPGAEIRLWLTPTRFVSHPRDWLAKTALGALHPDGQALEPLLIPTGGILILPASAWIQGQTLTVRDVGGGLGQDPVWMAERPEAADSASSQDRFEAVALALPGRPQTQGLL